MDQKRITVEYKDGDQAITVTVARANALMGMQRSIASYEGVKDEIDQEAPGPANPQQQAARVLRSVTYPDLTACTVEARGIPWPLTFEDFCELPDDFIVHWERAAYQVNPHWNPSGRANEAEQEKKA